jgi:hypothetical protein
MHSEYSGLFFFISGRIAVLLSDRRVLRLWEFQPSREFLLMVFHRKYLITVELNLLRYFYIPWIFFQA